MHVSLEEVGRLAELARLKLTKEEAENMQTDLGSILEYVNRLQTIDTAGVLEGHLTPQVDFRSDESLPADDVARELILSDFPDRLGDALRVPAVFDKPKGSS